MMDHFGIVKAPTGVGPEGRLGHALARVPRPLLPDVPGRSEPGHGRGAGARRRGAGVRRQGRAVLGHRAHPAGAAQRQEDVSRLREVRGARHPDLRVRRRARAPHPVRAAVRRLARRGVLVLPRAEDHHAPRRRAVDRADGEAAAEVAEPLLLDQRVRAQALQQGHHPTSRTRAAPTRSSTPGTSRWACRSTASSPSCRTCRSATTSGRSSSTRTRRAC